MTRDGLAWGTRVCHIAYSKLIRSRKKEYNCTRLKIPSHFQTFDEVDETGKITAKFSIVATVIYIVPGEPIDGSGIVEIDTLEVDACFKQVETTVTTTAGVTTTTTSTTRFTPTQTIVTTVATSTPAATTENEGE